MIKLIFKFSKYQKQIKINSWLGVRLRTKFKWRAVGLYLPAWRFRTTNLVFKVTLSMESDSNTLLKSSSKNQLKLKNLTHQCSPLFECNVTELTLKGWSFKLSASDASFGFFWTIYVSPIIIWKSFWTWSERLVNHTRLALIQLPLPVNVGHSKKSLS